mgnify:FL=1
MPTSNSTNFAMNGLQLMESALRLSRQLGIGQSVDAEVYNIAKQNLNIMMRHWENSGVRIWGIERGILFPSYGQAQFDIPVVTSGVPSAYCCLESDYRQNSLSVAAAAGASSVTLSDAVEYVAGDYIGIASQSNGLMWFKVNSVVGQVVNLYEVGTTTAANLPYAASADAIVVGFTTLEWQPLRIIEARRKDLSDTTGGVEVPLKIVGKFDYERIPNKLLQSIPIQIYEQVMIDHTRLFVWPTTAYSNWAIGYSYERRYQDIDSSINSLDFPPEAYEALRYGLASRLGVEFAIDGNRQMYLDAKAEQYFQVMRNWSSGKASVRFGVAR